MVWCSEFDINQKIPHVNKTEHVMVARNLMFNNILDCIERSSTKSNSCIGTKNKY